MRNDTSANASQFSSENTGPTGPRTDDPARGHGAGPDGPFFPWYSPHTGSGFSNYLKGHDLQTRQKRAKIYPAGVKIEAVKSPFSMAQPVAGCLADPDNKRGEIEGFSHEAARRLRETFMTQKVDGYTLWAVTLTTHGLFTPDQWRAVMKRFRTAVKDAGWAGVWRVELQKRKAPHAHVAFWLPPGVTLGEVAALWLRSTGETDDSAARQHAVHGREIPADETGWAVYMGLHDGKHKAEQLGWKGKQWGIWNREAFTEREAVEFVLSEREHALFLRILRNWDAADRQRRAHHAAKEDRYFYFLAEHGLPRERIPDYALPPPPPRPRPRHLHRGNLLRLLDGEFVKFVVAAIQAGRVGTSAAPRVDRITREMLSVSAA